MSKTIKKNFFAPLASGPGAMRRAAVLLLVMMLTTMTAWAQNPFDEYGGTGDLTISTPGRYSAAGVISGNLIIETEGAEGEVILDVSHLNVLDIQLMNGKLTLNVNSDSEITAGSMQVTTLNMDGGTISCGNISFESGTVSGGTIDATNNIYPSGSITGGTLTAGYGFYAAGSNNLTISGGIISAQIIDILGETTINVTDPKFSIAADTYENIESEVLTISGRSLIDEGGNVYAAGEVDLSAVAGKTLKPAYSVAFDENGGSTVTDLMVAGGMKATEPATTREGYTFVRWNNGEDAYDFNTVVTSDLTLKAHWKKQLSNSDITVSAIADQTYTGSAIEPTVTVIDGETDITDQCDFAITDNTAVGTANVAITAKSESVVYSGSTSTTFTILPKAVTITADNDTKTYDGTPLTKNTFTTSALESGDTHTFTVVMSSGSTITNVGTQPNVIASVDGVDVNTGVETAVGNYLVTTVNGTLTIDKAPLIVTAKDHIIFYGNAAANDGVEYSGFVNGETESDLGGDLTYTYSKNNSPYGEGNDAPGEYVITPSGLTSNNYEITFVPGKLTVKPVIVKVSVVDVADGEEIEGAHVQVIDGNRNVVKDLEDNNVEWTSDGSTHTIEGLKTGVIYTLHETVAPDGYVRPTDYTFTIDVEGNVTTTNGTMTQEGVLLVENSKTRVEISVIDIATREVLAGPTIQVIDPKGKVVEEWASTMDNHIIEGLNTGDAYTLRENVAIEGYVGPSDDYHFTIDETGKITTTGPTATDEEGNTVLLVENTKTGDLKVTNTVYSDSESDADQVFEFTVTLGDQSINGTYGDMTFENGVATFTLKGGQEKTATGLPTTMTYTVTGPNVIGFQLSGSNVVEGTIGNEASTATFKYIKLIDVSVAIIWNDNNNQDGKRPSEVSVILKANDEQVGSKVLNDRNEWRDTFKNQPSCTPEGSPIVYSWEMPATADYNTLSETTVDGHGHTMLTLTYEPELHGTLFAADATNKWMTWCDKYAYVKPEGVTVYKVSGVENNTVTLEKVSDVIPAYTPVLLYREEAGEDAVTATFSALGTAPTSGYDSSTGIVEANLSDNVTLYGNSGDEPYASGSDNNIFAISDLSDTQSYVLRNGHFVAVDKDGGIGAHRCWLNVTKSTTNGARLLSINTGGESTGIETTNFTNSANSSGAWYGIDGRKLDGKPTKKGLYIYNGKKQVIK